MIKYLTGLLNSRIAKADPELKKWAELVAPGETFTVQTTQLSAGAADTTIPSTDVTTAVTGKKARVIGYQVSGDIQNITIQSDDGTPIVVTTQSYTVGGVSTPCPQFGGIQLVDKQTTAVSKKFVASGGTFDNDGDSTITVFYTTEA